MDAEFPLILHEIGWENFWQISEPGSKLLTAEFLCTLKIEGNGVSFRLFNKNISLTWKELSQHFGFHGECVVDMDIAIPKFDKSKFWKEISDEDNCRHTVANAIQLPTLRFIHRWLGITLFPRDDPRTVRIEDLQIMFAMAKRRKIAPVKAIMDHWIKTFERKFGHIEYVSLVTRLANNLGLMENATLDFIEEDWPKITIEHFRQGQMIKRRKE